MASQEEVPINAIHFDDNPINMDFVERYLADIQQHQQQQTVEQEPAVPPGTVLECSYFCSFKNQFSVSKAHLCACVCSPAKKTKRGRPRQVRVEKKARRPRAVPKPSPQHRETCQLPENVCRILKMAATFACLNNHFMVIKK